MVGMSSTDVSRWRCHVLVAVDLLNALAWNILMRSMLASGLLGIVLEHDGRATDHSRFGALR